MAFLGWEAKQEGRSIRIVPRSLNNWKFSTNCGDEKSSNCLLDSAHSAFQEMACVADWKKPEYFTLDRRRRCGSKRAGFLTGHKAGFWTRGGSVVLGGKTGSDFGREIDACTGEGSRRENYVR